MFVVLADVGVRAAESRLPPLNEWNDWEATNKVAAMERLAKRSGGAYVVAVGSSMANANIDPQLLTELMGQKRPAFNAALNGASARLLELWTLHVVVPILRPRIVVIGVSSREFNDLGEAGIESYRHVRHSAGGRRVAPDVSISEKVTGIAEERSAIIANRARLRRPSQLLRHEAGEKRAAVNRLGVLNALRLFTNATYGISDRFRNEVAPQSFSRFAVGGIERRSLERLIDGLVAKKIRTVLLKMPVTDDLPAFHPRGIEDYRAFERELADLVADMKVRLIDMDARFPSTAAFADPYHLNGTGRKAFTEILAAAFKS